jgi:hypothetical protein
MLRAAYKTKGKTHRNTQHDRHEHESHNVVAHESVAILDTLEADFAAIICAHTCSSAGTSDFAWPRQETRALLLSSRLTDMLQCCEYRSQHGAEAALRSSSVHLTQFPHSKHAKSCIVHSDAMEWNRQFKLYSIVGHLETRWGSSPVLNHCPPVSSLSANDEL